MKKLITILLLMCISTPAFAGNYRYNSSINTTTSGHTMTTTGSWSYKYVPSTADYVAGGAVAGLALIGLGAFCYHNFSTKNATNNLTQEQYLIEQQIRNNNGTSNSDSPINYGGDYNKI